MDDLEELLGLIVSLYFVINLKKPWEKGPTESEILERVNATLDNYNTGAFLNTEKFNTLLHKYYSKEVTYIKESI